MGWLSRWKGPWSVETLQRREHGILLKFHACHLVHGIKLGQKGMQTCSRWDEFASHAATQTCDRPYVLITQNCMREAAVARALADAAARTARTSGLGVYLSISWPVSPFSFWSLKHLFLSFLSFSFLFSLGLRLHYVSFWPLYRPILYFPLALFHWNRGIEHPCLVGILRRCRQGNSSMIT